VFPPPDREKCGTILETGFELASKRVMEMVDVETPSATIPLVPEIVELSTETFAPEIFKSPHVLALQAIRRGSKNKKRNELIFTTYFIGSLRVKCEY
jgi:hypothetical protein